ncbi:MAG: four helix bundle protein [Candidatus Peribacteraceae bacterium]|nr:four helix bundle protein [Candidatus Peribacteraceae bacterium]
MSQEEPIKGYKDLIVWKKAMDLVDLVYDLTDAFPREELFALTSQIRRSVVSIPSNIAEGKNRGTRKEYRHFLLNSFGSAAELETQLLIAKRRRYGNIEAYPSIESLLNEVSRMLNVLIHKLGLPIQE